MIHQLLHTWRFLPEVMLVVCQPNRQQHAGTELQEALMQLLGHKIEPTEGKKWLMKTKEWLCACSERTVNLWQD